MMDISDGVASDIRHIMAQSRVGAELDIALIPTDFDLRYALSGGEDYELLLTVEESSVEALIEDFSARFGAKLTPIGRIIEGDALRWVERGAPVELDLQGFRHF